MKALKRNQFIQLNGARGRGDRSERVKNKNTASPNDEIKNPTLTFKKSPSGIGTSLFAVNDVGDRSTGNMRTSGRPALR